MAKGKKTGGRNFAKGQVSNPRGGGALSPQVRAIRKITLEHIEEVADLILDGNIDKLKELAANPETSVLKVWLAKAAATGIQKGDLHALDAILNRIMGRPRESITYTGSLDMRIAQDFEGLMKLSEEELRALLKDESK